MVGFIHHLCCWIFSGQGWIHLIHMVYHPDPNTSFSAFPANPPVIPQWHFLRAGSMPRVPARYVAAFTKYNFKHVPWWQWEPGWFPKKHVEKPWFPWENELRIVGFALCYQTKVSLIINQLLKFLQGELQGVSFLGWIELVIPAWKIWV